jgi:hypothetical protein
MLQRRDRAQSDINACPYTPSAAFWFSAMINGDHFRPLHCNRDFSRMSVIAWRE